MNSSIFYPKRLIEGNIEGSLYIYFKSLEQASPPGPEIYRAACEYINHDITAANNNTDLSAMDAAFTFLENVIASESAKETAFLNFLQTEMGENQTIQIPSLSSDWKDFVLKFQELLHQNDHDHLNLKNELSRLQKNKDRYDKSTEEHPLYYLQDSLSKTQQHIKDLLNTINQEKANTQAGRKLLEAVLEKYGDDLIQLDDNGKPILNKDQLVSLIIEISIRISEIYTTKYYSSGYDGTQAFNKKNIDEILKDNTLDEQIRYLIKKTQALPFTSQGMVSSLKLNEGTFGRQNTDIQLLRHSIDANESGQKLADQFIASLKNYRIPEDTFKVIGVHSAYAEISALVTYSLSQSSFGGINIGQSGSKPDNLLGYLSVNLDAIDPTKNNSDYKKLQEIYQIITDLSNEMKNTNTTNYYKAQSIEWTNALNQINEILNSISKSTLKLKDCFLIEDSTKNYLALYGMNRTGKLEKAPHGGSLGANLFDQLNKIQALADTGAISEFGLNWLYAAILNSGPGMVGAEQKSSLEHYLAAFVAVLLFDDQVNIAAESIMETKESNTSVQKLHLFSVNNGYYPLSYVLKLTYDSLKSNYERLKEDYSDVESGVKVEIYGYVSEPNFKDLPYDQHIAIWSQLSAEAQKSTKIKMSFLVNFINVLEGLLKPPQ